jgi:uncharacterized phage-associated protein
MYYCQGFSLGLTGTGIFGEKIWAWDHGPVVRQLWEDYNHHADAVLPVPMQFDESVFSAIQKDIINSTLETVGSLTGSELRNQTHKEPTWLSHSVSPNKGDDKEITGEEMETYFKTLLDTEKYCSEFHQSHNQLLENDSIELPDSVNSAESFIEWVHS